MTTEETSSVGVKRAAPLTYRQQIRFIQNIWHSEYYGIERWTMLGLLGLRFPTPFLLFSELCLSKCELRSRKSLTDLYCIVRLGALLFLLYSAGPGYWVHGLIATFLLADLMISLMSGILLNRPGLYGRPVSATRSVLLALVNFWEINAAFAVVYLTQSAACNTEGSVIEPGQLLYFSVITTMTIGYGDVHPCNGGYYIVVSHAFTALLLATLILSLFVAQLRFEGPSQEGSENLINPQETPGPSPSTS